MHKILLVEDDTTIATMYKVKLDAHGYKVKLTHHGLEALKTLPTFKPDLILLDLRMPVMDGEKFLEKLRNKGDTTPVVVLTNLNREEAPRTIWHHGISGFFVKAHSTPKELVDIIKSVAL